MIKKTPSKIELCGVDAQAILPHYVNPVSFEKRRDRDDTHIMKSTTRVNFDGVIHDEMMVGSGHPKNNTVNTSLGTLVVPSNLYSDSLITLGGGFSPPKEVVETFEESFHFNLN